MKSKPLSRTGFGSICRALLLASYTLITASYALAEIAEKQEATQLSYSVDQAKAGEQAYANHCSSCHGIVLEGSGPFPALANAMFTNKWGGKPADELARHIRRMPPEITKEQSTIDEAMYTDIMAFILQANDILPGANPLPSSTKALGRLSIPKIVERSVDLHSPSVTDEQRNAILENVPEITISELNNPDISNWVHWGGTYSGHNFSPLTQINGDTIGSLRPSWKLPLQPAEAHAAPLVYHGIMYLHTYPDSVVALDATRGDILWRYKHPLQHATPSGKLGIAIKNDLVFLPTSDMKLLAIDARSGRLIWEHQIALEKEEIVGDYKREGNFLRSAPIVVNHNVIQGVAGPLVKKGAFVLAVDIETGKEVWRFNTIPQKGEPGGNTWNGLSADERTGGSIWHYGSYDRDLNLVFFGVSQTYDTAALLVPSDKEGISNEGLYTNSTVALDPDTGELVWHFQHQPAEQWDMDWAFERQIVELQYKGKLRKAVITIGKIGILDAIDASTGEFLFSVDLGVQNYITGIDPKTGEKQVDPEKLPHPGMNTIGCPHYVGARNWLPTGYHRELKKLYVPIFEQCGQLTIDAASNLTSGLYSKMIPNPQLPRDQLGQLLSVDLENQQVEWRLPQEMPISTGILTTAGHLIFAGDMEPSLKAYNIEAGETLWHYKFDQAPSAGITSFAVDGQQYIAVSVGIVNNTTRHKAHRIEQQTGIHTDVGKDGAALWVFSLQANNQEFQQAR